MSAPIPTTNHTDKETPMNAAEKGRKSRLTNTELVTLAQDGVSADDIADIYGMTRSNVVQRLHRLGYSKEGEPLTFVPALDPLPDMGELPEFESALCAEVDPDIFHPEKGATERPGKSICARCDSRVECLEWALDHPSERGIWGGLNHRERLTVLKKRAQGEVADDAA